MARPVPVILIALAATAGAVVRQALHKQRFEASVAFRVVERLEGQAEADAQPQTKRQLRDYMMDGIFTRKRCRRLVDKYKLYPEWTVISLDRGVDALRSDINVEVWQNYFLRESWGDATPRSARIRITYGYTDLEKAVAVVGELGDMIQRHEATVRRELARQAAHEATLMEQRAGARMDELRRRLTQAQVALAEAPPHEHAALQVEISQLRPMIEATELQMVQLHSEAGMTELRAGLEANHLLMGFYKTDTSQSPPSSISKTTRLIIVGLIVFIFFLPISGIAVAAFDPLLYTTDDIQRLGLRSLGQLSMPRGYTYGSLKERRARRPQ